MYSYHSILECYNLFSGDGLSMRSFRFIIEAVIFRKKIHCLSFDWRHQ